jgi:hypothetical protein
MRGLMIGLALGVSLWLLPARHADAQALPLEVTLLLGQVAYEPGAPVSFTIRVRNTSREPVTVQFPTAQRFDLAIQSEAGILDRWSRGRAFAQIANEIRWGPGETVAFVDVWTPGNRFLPGVSGQTEEQPLQRGLYLMQPELVGAGVRIAGQPAALVIGTATVLEVGCTTFPASPFAVQVPISLLASLIQPGDALHSIWQRTVPLGSYAGYSPRLQNPNDLIVINERFPLTICMSAAGAIALP